MYLYNWKIRPLAIGHKAMGHKAAFCNNPFIGLHPDMTTALRQLAPMKMAEICCHDSYVILECVY